MPISVKHNLCFIHIPKNAGTTIEKSLGMDDIESFYQKKKYKDYGVPPQHLTFEELSKELDLSGYKKFAIVRNPFDRIVSEFHHYENNELAKNYHDLCFTEFVETCLNLENKERKYIFDGHLEPQVDFIRGDFDIKIFKYEKISECFDWLMDITQENLVFGHERKASNRLNYKEYYKLNNSLYCLKTISLVEDFYKEDLKQFNYEF